MSHYANIDEKNIVTQVIVAEQDFIDALNGEWIQTSYNTISGIHYNAETGLPSEDQSKALRKNYAGIGYTYDRERDAFIPPKPFESWLLNEDTCLWESPVPYPSDGLLYSWNESIINWVIDEYNSLEVELSTLVEV